jgi:hypothetical protein
MMIPPSGQPNTNPAFPPQRKDRLCSHSGKFPEPAELRNFDMPPLDSEKESTRGDTIGDCDYSHGLDLSLPARGKVVGPGRGPPIWSPLFPVEPRSHFLRRGLPIPPPLPGSMFGTPHHFVPPRAVFPMDLRSHFLRRDTPFLPPPPDKMSAASSDHFTPRDSPGPPYPPFPVRNVYSPRAITN